MSERRNVGMSECRNVGKTECRNVGMKECCESDFRRRRGFDDAIQDLSTNQRSQSSRPIREEGVASMSPYKISLEQTEAEDDGMS